MAVLPALFGRVGSIFSNRATAVEEVSRAEYCSTMWLYYDNNGLYSELRAKGQSTTNAFVKELYNPANRAVEFYAATIWPGSIDHALPLIVDSENPNVDAAIRKLWAWSNWGVNRQISVRRAAIIGDTFLKVSQATDGSKRVYLQAIKPEYVTDKDTDERGYITYCRIDVPQKKRINGKITRYTHTEVWDQGRVRIFNHENGANREVEQLGAAVADIPLGEWGINFVPIVHIQQRDVGDEWGVNCFMTALSKIDEANAMATRLHSMLYRYNDVTWALRANGMDAAGRPLPAPLVNDGTGQTATELEVGGDRVIRLPGTSELQSLIPQLDYSSALTILQDQIAEIERDLPETMYSKLNSLPEMSGKALRLVLAPAIAKAEEARGNHEDGLIRAQKMALTIGRFIGAWSEVGIGDVGLYDSGDLDHHFAERPIIRTGREEIADLAVVETSAGIPLTTSLRNSGWTQDELDRMAEEKAEEQAAQQTSLATAVLNAQDQPQSNGMENPVFNNGVTR